MSGIRKEIKMSEEIEAPIAKGDPVGAAEYYLNDKKIGSVKILADGEVEKAGFLDYLKKSLSGVSEINSQTFHLAGSVIYYIS